MKEIKQTYVTPCFFEGYELQTGSHILAGSVVTTDTTVETAGQGVEEHDFSGSEFEVEW